MIFFKNYFFLVDEMIAEVDLDGDGRIDFEGRTLCIINLKSPESINKLDLQFYIPEMYIRIFSCYIAEFIACLKEENDVGDA